MTPKNFKICNFLKFHTHLHLGSKIYSWQFINFLIIFMVSCLITCEVQNAIHGKKHAPYSPLLELFRNTLKVNHIWNFDIALWKLNSTHRQHNKTNYMQFSTSHSKRNLIHEVKTQILARFSFKFIFVQAKIFEKRSLVLSLWSLRGAITIIEKLSDRQKPWNFKGMKKLND